MATSSRDFISANSDYVDTNDPCTSWPASDWTLSCWVRLDDGQPSALNALLGVVKVGDTDRLFANVDTAGALYLLLGVNGDTARAQTAAAIFADGQTSWTHIAFRQDWTANEGGGQLDIFVNGSKQTLDDTNNGDTTGLTAGSWNAPGGNLAIGAINYVASGLNYHIDGQLADFRRYSEALSDADIAVLATGNMSALMTATLEAEWLRNGAVTDYMGNFPPTNHGSDDSTERPPVSETMASRGFDSTIDQCVDTNDPMTDWPKSDFTLAFWIRLDDGQPASYRGIFGVDNTDPVTNRVSVLIPASGKLEGYMGAGGTSAIAQTAAAVFPDGQTGWYHIALRQDWTANEGGGQLDIFVNGSKQTLDETYNGDTSALTPANWTANGDMPIGAVRRNDSTLQYLFDGQLADFRRYSEALSDADIAVLATGNMSALMTATLEAEWLRNGAVSDYMGNFSPTNHGSSDSPERPPVSEVTGCRDFDSTIDQCVNTNDPMTSWPKSDFTVAFWARLDDGQTESTDMFWGVRADPQDMVLQMLVSSGSLQASFEIDDVLARTVILSVFPDGQTGWYHIALRQDWTANEGGGQLDIFVNGSKQTPTAPNTGDTSALTAASWVSPAIMYVGARNREGTGRDSGIDGQISDFMRYSRALTDNEILSLSKGEEPAMFADLETHILHMGQMRDETGNIEPSNYGSADSALGPPVPGGN